MADLDVELAELRAANEALTRHYGQAPRALAAIAAVCEEGDTVRVAVSCLLATDDGMASLRSALEDEP